jgi:xylan 1,4-beta-xylosidase
MNSTIELSVACDRRGEPFKHFWSFCVGAGRANEGLRADWQEQLKLAASLNTTMTLSACRII